MVIHTVHTQHLQVPCVQMLRFGHQLMTFAPCALLKQSRLRACCQLPIFRSARHPPTFHTWVMTTICWSSFCISWCIALSYSRRGAALCLRACGPGWLV